jgi:hypothetical protein
VRGIWAMVGAGIWVVVGAVPVLRGGLAGRPPSSPSHNMCTYACLELVHLSPYI